MNDGPYANGRAVLPPRPDTECYKTLIPKHDYQPTEVEHVYECTLCHRRMHVEVIPYGQAQTD